MEMDPVLEHLFESLGEPGVPAQAAAIVHLAETAGCAEVRAVARNLRKHPLSTDPEQYADLILEMSKQWAHLFMQSDLASWTMIDATDPDWQRTRYKLVRAVFRGSMPSETPGNPDDFSEEAMGFYAVARERAQEILTAYEAYGAFDPACYEAFTRIGYLTCDSLVEYAALVEAMESSSLKATAARS
jgi:hypothetical protein